MTGATSSFLAGVTILDLAGVGPAPRCLRVLADLGARWIRLMPPARAERIQPLWFQYGSSRGVQQCEIDLKDERARDAFLQLAARADVVVESFRPGVAARLGVDFAAVSKVNPGVVYCSLTGYGQTGPYANQAGHDLNYQALAGALATTGRRADGGPALPGLTVADSAGGGWQAATRILAALVARKDSGRGAYLDVSAAEGMVQLMSLSVDEYLATGVEPTAGGHMFTGRYAFYDLYETADAKWLAIAAIERKFFANLCQACKLDSLIPSQFDADAQPRIREAFKQVFRSRTRAEWISELEGLDVCVSPVLSIAELTTDAHWLARGMFSSFEHPDHGPVRQTRPFGDAPADARGPAPANGQTSPGEILRGLGFDERTAQTLLETAAIR